MAVGLTIPNKQGKVRDTNPLPVKLVEGDDVLDLVEKGSLVCIPTFLVNEDGEQYTSANPLPVSATLNVGDIEIGAVELKDGDSDTRADIESSGTKNALYVQSESLAQESGGNLDTIAGDTTSLDTKIPAQGQALAGASMPVVLPATQITTLTPPAAITGFALETTLQSIKTALEIIDDWDESDRCKTNTILKPTTSGGLSIFRSLDIDETEEDVKQSAGQLYGWYIYNNATSTRYVKFYNATAANVTVGTTTPVLTIPIPGGSAANVFTEQGIAFSTAICVAATTGVADNNTGAPAANDVVCNLFYN